MIDKVKKNNIFFFFKEKTKNRERIKQKERKTNNKLTFAATSSVARD